MRTALWRVLILAGLLLAPSPVYAHPVGGAMNGWQDGFNHPLHGWDHLVVMIAVGLWAAQQRGRAVWLIPLTFVGVMSLGGIAGATGVSLPGVEPAILLSVAVFGALVVRRACFRTAAGVLLAGFFAFFHGFAHGAEMPGSASLLTFGFGFVLATLLLHGLGLATARVVAVLAAFLVGSSAMAQQTTNAPAADPAPPAKDGNPAKLPGVVVEGRQDSLIGIAGSATQGTVGADELAGRPSLRVGEILETVPGVIITQHAGGGKANQYFLRGFNLDHGTDIAIDLDGMPLNLPSHAHGPGYADLNIVIPEFLEKFDFEKGPYYAANGDFSSAAAAHLQFYRELPRDFVTLEGGLYGFARGVFGMNQKLGDGNLVYGGEIFHDDGPWVRGDDYLKLNGLLTYSSGDNANGYSLSARAYHGKWNSSDQIPESSIGTGQVPFFGAIDPSDGGNSQRYSLQAEWHRADENSTTKLNAYAFYYDLDLFSDFTYYLADPVHGDQFEQKEHRIAAGLDGSHALHGELFGRDMDNTFGFQARDDLIDNGLYETENRQRVDKLAVYDVFDDVPLTTPTIIPATVRQDRILETGLGLYYENKIQWAEKFRGTVGLRGDILNFNVDDLNPANSGNKTGTAISPKLSAVFGPWAKTELYLNGGFGYHSEDARGSTATVNPPPLSSPTTPLPVLYQTKGAEVGIRTLAVPGLQSTLSFWYLHSASELLYDGDTGQTEDIQIPSDRYGVEWGNYYSPTKWLTLDLDYADSTAQFVRPDANGGENVPEAIQQVLAAGITAHDLHGFSASLRLRYFGPRNLISTGAVKSDETILLNLGLSYEFNKTWSISADIYNLMDRRDHDIDYYYTSRVTPAAAPVTQVHFHPVEPIQARLGVTARF